VLLLQGYGNMLPGLTFKELHGAAFVQKVALSIGEVLQKKIQALEVSSVPTVYR